MLRTREGTTSARRLALALVGATVLVFAGDASATEPLRTSRSVKGEGSWTVERPSRLRQASVEQAAARRASPWTLDADIDAEGKVRGSVMIEQDGTQVVARVQGQSEGRRIWGDVLSDDGEQLGTFEGRVGPNGLEGTFTTREDDQGTWRWNGPAVQ